MLTSAPNNRSPGKLALPAHFWFFAASVDIKLPDWAGYAIVSGAMVALLIVGVLIYSLLKKKGQSDGKD